MDHPVAVRADQGKVCEASLCAGGFRDRFCVVAFDEPLAPFAVGVREVEATGRTGKVSLLTEYLSLLLRDDLPIPFSSPMQYGEQATLGCLCVIVKFVRRRR
jgi:hypothetical protein